MKLGIVVREPDVTLSNGIAEKHHWVHGRGGATFCAVIGELEVVTNAFFAALQVSNAGPRLT